MYQITDDAPFSGEELMEARKEVLSNGREATAETILAHAKAKRRLTTIVAPPWLFEDDGSIS